jgi:hypothetical protein
MNADGEAWLRRQLSTVIAMPEPPLDLVNAMVECLQAGACAVCGRAFAEPGEAQANAIFQGRALCEQCAPIHGNPQVRPVSCFWRPNLLHHLDEGD